jgi:hypothetical protein
MRWVSNFFGQAEVAAAITGAVVALLATWAREWIRERRRRLNVAAAFVADLRLHRRMATLLDAYAKKEHVYYWAGFSEAVFRTLLGELAGLSPTAFRCVRQAYGQMQHCNFLTERFRELRRSGLTVSEARDADNFTEAYPAAIRQVAILLDDALSALRCHAPRSSYTVALPPLHLTAYERALMEHTD